VAIEFAIDDERVDEATHVVVVHGEVDLFTAPEFKERISALIDAGVQRVVVDLTGVSFIDSSSLGVLIGAHKRLAAADPGDGEHGLTVVCSDRAIVNTFKITGLDQVFPIVATREDAVAKGGRAS
jgi:anti-sigma B factor antagonist